MTYRNGDCDRCGRSNIKVSYEPKGSVLIFGGRPFYENRCKDCEGKLVRKLDRIIDGMLEVENE